MKQFNKSIKGKLWHYFQQRLNIKESTKDWWRCDCPLCGGKFTMGINLEEYRVKCFKCEEPHLDPIKLLMEVEGFEIRPQAYKFLSIQQEYEYYESSAIKPREYKEVLLPKGFKLITSGDNAIAKAARHYMKKRGFDIDSLSLKGVGYCDEGEYFGYIIFPYYRKGELIYYQGRLFMGAGTKMKNPLDTEFGIGKSQVIFNVDAFYIYERAYLVESITNALTLGDAAGSINGKSISQNQMSQILMSPCKRVVIILDPDAWSNAVDLGLSMVHYKKTKVIRLPDEVDVNDLGKQRTLKIVKSTKWQSYMDIYKFRLNETGPIDTYNRRGPNYVDKRGL